MQRPQPGDRVAVLRGPEFGRVGTVITTGVQMVDRATEQESSTDWVVLQDDAGHFMAQASELSADPLNTLVEAIIRSTQRLMLEFHDRDKIVNMITVRANGSMEFVATCERTGSAEPKSLRAASDHFVARPTPADTYGAFRVVVGVGTEPLTRLDLGGNMTEQQATELAAGIAAVTIGATVTIEHQNPVSRVWEVW